jgi:hypothetical protein
MHIFIDESGTFTHPAASPHAVSVVGALIIPDSVLPSLGQKYARLRTELPMEDGEVKGRLLSENQIADVISVLSRHQVLYEATAIDMGIHTASDVVAHRAAQAERITGHLTPQHHPNVRRGVWELRRRLERMSPQLYVQSVATFSLIERVIRQATLSPRRRSRAMLDRSPFDLR